MVRTHHRDAFMDWYSCGDYFSYQMVFCVKTIARRGARGNGYILAVENQKKEAGRYRDTIHLKTDSKLKPEIKVNVYGNIYEAPQKGKEKVL
jgi:hypothetical protein